MDVIVVGAGIVGCSIGYELARRGAAVEIIDDRPVGMGATQASAGVLAPYLEAREGNPLLDLAVRSLNLYDEFTARVSSDAGRPVVYQRTGTIDVAFEESELAALRLTAAVLSKRHVRAAMLDAAETRAEEPQVAAGAIGALLVDAHGFVLAFDLVRAAADAAQRHGARLVLSTRVSSIARDGSGVTVRTADGLHKADAVVVAAGSWSNAASIDGRGVSLPVRPVRGQLLSLAWRGEPLKRTTWSSRCYLVPWPDGTLLVGATVEEAGFDERATVDGVRGLLEASCDVIPRASTAAFNGVRVGLRPGTPDNLPIIGRSTLVPNVVYATGHYRNGVLLAPLTAQLVSDLVLDGQVDPALDVVSPSRFGEL